jgi:hypothetical protein
MVAGSRVHLLYLGMKCTPLLSHTIMQHCDSCASTASTAGFLGPRPPISPQTPLQYSLPQLHALNLRWQADGATAISACSMLYFASQCSQNISMGMPVGGTYSPGYHWLYFSHCSLCSLLCPRCISACDSEQPIFSISPVQGICPTSQF